MRSATCWNGRVALDQRVPTGLGVEHGRPQLAARGDPGLLEHVEGDLALGVADALQAERVGEALGRVDREHEHPPAVMQRGHRRDRRGHRRLADPAGAAGDRDLLGRDQLVQGAAAGLGRARAHRPSSSASHDATCLVLRKPPTRVNR
jgi:hypothetical protein